MHDYYDTKQLTIEAFAHLAISGKGFSGRSSIKTYLFTIARNLTSRHLKQRGKEEHLPFEDAIAVLCVSEEDTPHGCLTREETRQQLHRVMQELNEDYNLVLSLLYFEELSYAEAAETMGKSATQIKHLAYRAKAALKKRLENEGFPAY